MAITKIINKNTAVPDRRPGIADIDLGEIAVNTYDGKMFIKQDRDGAVEVVQVGDDPTENVFYVSKGGKLGNKGTSLSDAFFTLDSAVQTVTTQKAFTFDEATCRRDLQLILDGLYLDIAFGTNYNQVTSGLSYQRASAALVKSQQLSATRGAINEAKGGVASVAEVKASTGFDGALQRSNRHFSEIIDILVRGAASTSQAADVVTFPSPSVLPTPDADHAAAIIQSNRTFLIDEVTAYITTNFPTLGGFNGEKCARDTGLILDAVRRDLILGTDYWTITAGNAYLRANSAYVLSDQNAATVGSVNFARDLVKALTGVTSDSTVDTLFKRVTDCIDGTFTVPQAVTTYPQAGTYANVAGRLDQTTAITSARTTLITDTTAYITTNYPSLVYDSAKCQRDTGFLIDALVADLYYSGNSASRAAALAYFVGTESQLGAGEGTATVAAFTDLATRIKALTNVTEDSRVDTLIGIVNGAIAAGNINGVAAETDISTAGLTTTEFDAIVTATADIKTATIVHGATNYTFSTGYNVLTCRRDVGYIVDAISHDVIYGGTHATTINAKSYFNGLTGAAQLPASQQSASATTYTHLGLIMGQLVTNTLTSNVYPASYADVTGNSGQYATATETGVITGNLVIITDAITANTAAGIPARVAPNLTSRGVSAELRNAVAGIIEIDDLIIQQAVERGKDTGDVVIYLKSGDYTINNPLKLPPKTAIVGDNLRTVTIRPQSVDSDLFYMDNGTFIKDVTFKDHQGGASCVAFDPRVDSSRAGPFIIQSPYVQNCTSITTDGVGMKIDGSKAWGLRSMVSDAFTQYNAAGTGVYLLNRGYAQLVSIFTISTATSIRAETGGQCSITNSNTSFGDFGLVASGSSSVLYQGVLDSDQLLYDDIVQVNNIVNTDSSDWLSTLGAYKKPNYADTMKFDSEDYYYTVLSVDSVGPGVYNIQFQPPLNQDMIRNQAITFRQRSVITSSSHTFEYVGAGTNTFTAIPQNGGVPDATKEVIFDSATNEGLVVFTSTDQLGDFRIGAGLTIRRQAGTIEGETFERSLYAILTPYILALEG